MRRTACEEIELLIDRETLGWNDAERLRVEQHLAGCSECGETLSLSRFVRDTLRDAASELPAPARSRAIRHALDAGERSAKLQHLRKRTLYWPFAAGLTVAAAAAAIALFVVSEPAEQLATNRASSATATAPLTTTPAAAPQEKEPPTAAALANEDGSRWIETGEREERTFAHAKAQLAPQSRVRFDAAQHTLLLSSGQVDIDVDASKGEPFRVQTEHFRVEVLGTRFSVTPATVTVSHGRVQVFDLNGAVLARELGAGTTFTYAGEPRKPSAQPVQARKSQVPAKTLLALARAALNRGSSSDARALVQRVDLEHAERAERAEATTLRAEAALLDRDTKGALRYYLEVSTRYKPLPAGENAAFAAAQLAAKVEPTRERALLESYLERYPRGRFTDEARQRLARIAPR